MSAVVVPFVKGLYLCDSSLGLPGGKTDLMGLFNSINPANYPHLARSFVVFAQLTFGLGRVAFYIDIRESATRQLVFTSNIHHAQFPNRDVNVQLAYTVQACRFPNPGLYLVELFCEDQWVADSALLLQ